MPASQAAAAAAPNPKVDAARAAWLAGDVDGARARLAEAGDDPRAVALLARADALAGHRDALARDLARLPAAPVAAIAPDTTLVDFARWSVDGAYLATIAHAPDFHGYTLTVWDVVAGRDVLAVDADDGAFGTDPATRAPILIARRHAEDSLGAYDLQSGHLLWTAGGQRDSRFFAVVVDTHGVVTAVDDKGTLQQFDVATGKHLRALASDVRSAALQLSADGATALDAETLYALPAAGSQLTKLDELPAMTSANQIAAEDLAPDGQTTAVALASGEITIRGRDGTVVADLPAEPAPPKSFSLTYLRDGTLLVLENNHHVRHFDTTGKRIAELDLPADLQPVVYNKWLVLGRGGHVLARHGAELVVTNVAGDHVATVSRFGGATRAVGLAWTPDGKALTVAGLDQTSTSWTVATGAAVPGAAAEIRQAPLDLVAVNERIFMLDAKRHPIRFVEVGEEPRTFARGGRTLAAVGAGTTLHVFDATTAQGLGTVELGAPIGAIAVHPDGALVATAPERGGVEIWDLRSRTRLATLVVDGSLAALAPDGRFERSGSAGPRSAAEGGALVWRAGDVDLPDTTAPATDHLAATLLASRPAASAVATTPAPQLAPRGCLPAGSDTSYAAVSTQLEGDTLTYCLRAYGGDDPYCFAADLAAKTITPVAATVDGLFPRDTYIPGADDDVHYPAITKTDSGTGARICASATVCHDLPIAVDDATRDAISEDGALFAIDTQPTGKRHEAEIYDVASGKRIARFPIRYESTERNGGGDDVGSLAFFGHTLMTVTTPCAGPCSAGVLYDLHGKRLGPFAVEASEYSARLFHDDYYVLQSIDDSFVVQSATTGKILVQDKRTGWSAAITPTRIARAIGIDYEGKGGSVVAYNASGKVVEEMATPRCQK